MAEIEAVFFNFDGVLCADRFNTTLIPEFPHVMKLIADTIFSGPEYCDSWMRGETGCIQINEIISKATGIDLSLLNTLSIRSVREMRINPHIPRFAESLNYEGIQIALVTNNMDIFNDVTIPEKRLNKVFPVILNSYDYGLMKHDDNGKLFDIALNKLNRGTYDGTWLIDDALTCCALFSQKGGRYLYFKDANNFKTWSEAIFA